MVLKPIIGSIANTVKNLKKNFSRTVQNRCGSIGFLLFIGLGNMGGRMAKNLHNAGYPLIGYDIEAAKCEALAAIGATAGKNTTEVVRNSDVILTSLRSSDVFRSVAERHFIPNAREGNVFIDLGTADIDKRFRWRVRLVCVENA